MSTTTTTARAKLVQATTPTIYNLSMPNSGTEYSQALTKGTKKFLVKMRNKSEFRMAFVENGTTAEWITVPWGCVYLVENLDLTDATIYLQTAANGETAEILEWV